MNINDAVNYLIKNEGSFIFGRSELRLTYINTVLEWNGNVDNYYKLVKKDCIMSVSGTNLDCYREWQPTTDELIFEGYTTR